MWNLRLSLMALGKEAGKPKTGLAMQSESEGNLEALFFKKKKNQNKQPPKMLYLFTYFQGKVGASSKQIYEI